ncbi:MAG: SUMF1/EgtB/PvdO family nonheme iron enzyme [Magnetococcus sp. YQC-5]
MTHSRLAWLVFLLVLASPLFAVLGVEKRVHPAEKRVALVIGNNEYTHVEKLNNAVADAMAMKQQLASYGFDVVYRENVNRKEMNKAIDEFLAKLSADSVGLMFYAGHGVQIKAANYLLPIDVEAIKENDVVHDSIDMSRVQDQLSETKAKFSLVILDACRDNPFKSTGSRSIGGSRGLAMPTSNASGIMVVYSAGANQQAIDRLTATDNDPNGLFTREFLKAMKKPGLKVQDLVGEVRQSVIDQAKSVGHVQTPAIYDQSVGTFFFTQPPVEKTTVPHDVVVPSQTDRETVFWQSAKDTQAGCRAYLEKYPQGEYVILARLCADSTQSVAARVVATEGYTSDPRKVETLKTDPKVTDPAPIQTPVPVETKVTTPKTDPKGTVPVKAETIVVNLTTQPKTATQKKAGGAEGVVPVGEFVTVPGGSFEMGCGPWQSDCEAWEKSEHTVTVEGFEIGQYEVTQGQWKSVMGANPSHFSSCGDLCPVEQVSWEDVQKFIKKLNGLGQGSYRMPTEAEWEFACRSGGRPEKYCGGDDLDPVAWHKGNSGKKTHPVGQKSPNGLGIFDMSGNVWEWVCSDYGLYDDQARHYGKCSIGGVKRVLRGGGWDDGLVGARSTERGSIAPGFKDVSLGIRLVRESR